MVKFIHLSDLHIHGDKKHRDNQNCDRVVDFVVNRYKNEKPIVLITGDIVDDGREDQYKNAVESLSPLVKNGFKVLATPGNHDYGYKGNFYYIYSQQLFRRYILGELLSIPEAKQRSTTMDDLYPMTTTEEEAVFIGLDSAFDREDNEIHAARGEVDKPQRDKLVKILKTYRDSEKKIVVYFHHHPFYRRGLALQMLYADEVLGILSGKVDFICFGHKHESDRWEGTEHNIEYDIDWFLASGKTTRMNNKNKFQYREVKIEGDNNDVSMVTFV